MSKTVDQRVVEMRFDNKQFEQNVSSTMSTLDKLKQGLKLEGATTGLVNVNTAVKGIDMSNVTNSVETLRSKFSALEVMGVTALANITNSAVNAGKRIVNALTIEPIKTGFQEYETQMGAIQTILANTQHEGTNLKDVNGALDELNTYADQTIYNFTEMTRNIGTFTAAGVGLDKSVTSIKGIANLAAISGSTSQQASTAMYQLSQALAAGRVSLMDWNSVVNAGMGGKVFQDALKRTAENQGKNVDELIKKYGSFRESLTQGEWLTADVLTETLTQLSGAYSKADLISQGYTDKQAEEILKLADTAVGAATEVKTVTQLFDTLKESAQSGWSQTWRILVGDFEEAKELLTSVSEVIGGVIGASAESRNKLLQDWKDLGGRKVLIEALSNSFEALVSVLKPIGEAFKDIFPGVTAKQLYDLTVRFRDFTEKLSLSDESAKNLKRTFKGIFSVFGIVVDLVKAVADGAGRLIGSLVGVEGGFLAVTGAVGDWLTNFSKSVREADIFKTVVDGIVGLLKGAIGLIKDFGSKVGEAFAGVGTGMGEAFGNLDFSGGLSLLNSGIFAGILLGVKKFVKGINESFEGGGVFSNIVGTLNEVRGCFEAYQQQLKAGTLIKIAGAIAILAGALLVISTIDGKALARSLGAITLLFGEMLLSLSLFSKMKTGFGAAIKMVPLMIGMSTAILILAAALKVLSTIDTNGLIKGLAAIGVLMLELGLFVSNVNGKGTIRTATGVLILSTALVVLAKAVKTFGSMGLKELGKGLLGVAGGLAVIAGAMRLMPKGMATQGIGILIVASALKVLASSISDFGGMSLKELGKGLGAMAASLLILAGAMRAMKTSISGAAALIVAAGAIAILTPALKSLGEMSTKQIVKSLAVLAGAFIAIGAAGLLLGPLVPTLLALSGAFALFGVSILAIGAGVTLIGVGLAAIATGITALATAGVAGATAFVASMSIILVGMADLIPTIAKKLGEAVVAFAVVIGDCAPQLAEAALKLISSVLQSLATHAPKIVDSLMKFLIGVLDALSANIPQLVVSVMEFLGALFQGVVDALKSIDTKSLLEGVIGLGLLTGLMYALSALGPLVPGAMTGIIGLGGLIAELAIVLAAVGGLAQIPGLEWLISEGGDLLGKIGTAIGQFVGGLAGGIAKGFTSSLPQIGSDLSAFMTNAKPFLDGIKSVDPSVIESAKALAQTVLVLTAADFLNGITSWLTGGDSLAEFGDQLVPFGEGMMKYSNAVNGINAAAIAASATAAKSLTDVADAIPNSGGLVSVFTGDNDFSDFGDQLVPFGEGLKDYSDAVTGINAGAVSISVTTAKEVIKMVKSMSDVDTSGAKSFKEALNTLAKSKVSEFLEAFSGSTAKAKNAGAKLLNNVLDGIKTKKGGISKAANTLVNDLAKAFTSKAEKFNNAGSKLMESLAKGITKKKKTVTKAVKDLSSNAVDTTKGYYDDFYDAGKYLVDGFAAGISSKTWKAEAKAKAMAKAAERAAENELDINSPSKKFDKIGGFVPMGFARGIDRLSKLSTTSAKDMATSAIETASKSISRISDVVNADIDSHPTISPVMDLSDIEAGANAIGRMLDIGSSVSVLGNIGAINTAMNRRNQNGNNNDIISAIKKLGKDLGDLGGGNSYTINGITYNDDDNINNAMESLIRIAKIEGRA